MLNRYPGFAVTGPDDLPIDPKGNPDLQRAIKIELAQALNGRIKLSIELQKTNTSGPVFMPHVVLVDKITDESFNAIRAKCEVDGWTIHSWSSVPMERVAIISGSHLKSLKTSGRKSRAFGALTGLS